MVSDKLIDKYSCTYLSDQGRWNWWIWKQTLPSLIADGRLNAMIHGQILFKVGGYLSIIDTQASIVINQPLTTLYHREYRWRVLHCCVW